MIKFPLRVLISFCLMLGSLGVSGQGTLRGVITDKADNAPLYAATVSIKGTSIGVVTDHNGAYVLPLRSGVYTIIVAYIGYGNEEEIVSLEDNQTIELNVSLGAIAFEGEEAVVTMQARGQLAAVNQQLRSNQIINVVSEERIRELPDENAAQAVSRLPGIHLDGSKVVIRGVEPKMNKIMINGVEMPSTEADNRATDLGMISANMLSGIEVYKTLTPDMDADAVGGVVNLRLREAQKGLHYSVTAQGTYNQQEKDMSKYLFWGDVSNRFLNDRLGILANFNYTKAKTSTDRYSKGFTNISNSTEFWEGDYIYQSLNVYDNLNKTDNIGGSLVLDYKLPGGHLVYSGMVTHTVRDATSYRDVLAFKDLYERLYLEHTQYTRLLLNNSLRYEQQIGIVSLDASISNVSIDHKDNFNWEARFGESGNFFFPDSVTEKNLRTANTWDPYNWMVPGMMETINSDLVEVRPGQYNENQWLADLNMKIPLRITEKINIDFKLGGKYKKKERKRNVTAMAYNYIVLESVNATIQPWLSSIGHFDGGILPFSVFRDNDYQPNRGFMNNEGARMDYAPSVKLLDEMFLNQVDLNPETTLLWDGVSNLTGDYWGWENYGAAYLMGEINLGKRLVLIPGLRYERVHNEYSAYKVHITSMSYWPTDTLTKPATHEHWLPHLHMRFRATDWWDIRFSYNNTLTRPDYNYAIPKVYYHTSQGSGSAGNPFIKPAVSENLDANFTFYARKLGLITIGGFYKRISDIFYQQETILKNIPDSSIVAEFPLETYPSIGQASTDFYLNSPHKAYIKGLEAEWQSNFTWLRGAWSGLVLNVNYTHVWSETKYMLHRMLFVIPPGGWLPEPTESDTFYVNKLINQANDIANVSLGYDYKGFSARLSFRLQGNVVSSVRSLPQLNGYTARQYKFDFVVKQRIPLKFADLEVFLNAINFTNVPKESYIDYPGGRQTTSVSYYGPQFQLGIRFRH